MEIPALRYRMVLVSECGRMSMTALRRTLIGNVVDKPCCPRSYPFPTTSFSSFSDTFSLRRI